MITFITPTTVTLGIINIFFSELSHVGHVQDNYLKRL